jgi:glycosyltransferase involved in cell wall biosynthesis
MISAVILTKNEEKNILNCVESVSWCDEVLVIDDQSTDKTVDLVKNTKAKVFIHPKENDFAKQRNFGLEKAKGDWVLFVDADERVSSALWYEIMQHVNASIEGYSGFYIRRNDIVWEKELKYGETGNIKFLRLAKKGTGEWTGKVHEVWDIKGSTMQLNNPLEHYPHTTVEKFLREINYYTDIRAKELYKNKTKVFWGSIILFPLGKFFLNYIIKRGFLDGVPGLISALMMSFHSFLVRSKLWMLWQKN